MDRGTLTELEQLLVAEWQKVALAFQLEIVAPFTLDLRTGPVTIPVLLKNFGGSRGMLLIPEFEKWEPYLNEMVTLGFGISTLTPDDSEPDRDVVVELLNDWGWSGSPQNKPSWLD
jgi:hypothetical protein